MENRYIISLLFVLCLIMGSFATTVDNSGLARTLRAKVVDSPDSVLSELEKIEVQKSPALPDYQINLLRSLAYNEKRMFSLVERYAMKTLASDSISTHKKDYLNALTLLSVAQAYFGNNQGSIATSIKAMELARQEGNNPAEYNILTTMAKTSFTMGERDRGYEYIDQIISEGSNSSDARVLANVSAAYGIKIVELYADDRFDEGLSEGKKRLALIEKIDKVGGSPAGFTDQQRAYAYARIASCAERLGKKDEAGKAFDAFMATDYAKNPIGRVYIMDYLLDSGQWRKALEFTAPLYPMFEGADTINGDYHSLLISDGRAEAGLGNYRKAYGLIQRAAAIQDSLYIREKSTKAQELASMFALNEKELALVNEKAKSQRKHILMLAASGFAILILIILILVWRAYQNSVRQQRIAAKRIDELIAQQPLEADSTPENQEDYQQFTDMQNKIICEGLFKSPNLNR
ncbi:MAG: hypothetical protein K2H76_02120, partial [Muribaculaceae bacterium]|nr:hypothetical protein [Muribaculaceae bacterium]